MTILVKDHKNLLSPGRIWFKDQVGKDGLKCPHCEEGYAVLVGYDINDMRRLDMARVICENRECMCEFELAIDPSWR